MSEIVKINGYDIKDLKAVRGYNTVADMKSDAKLREGQHIKTKGYYTVGDGGEAEYIIKSKTNEIIDEMIILSLYDNTLIAELVIGKELTSKQCGLKGDGETDETLKLNQFYGLNVDVNKTLNKGIYLITDTLYIKGKWRQNTSLEHNNSRIKFKFDGATIKYTGTANECSVMFHSMFNSLVEGFCIDRTSNPSYVDFIGCWFLDFNNFDIPSLGLGYNYSSFDPTIFTTQSVEHVNFNNGTIPGKIYIDSTSSFCNALFFNNIVIGANNIDVCVDILSANSNQDIVFNQCDLSYATDSIFKIRQAQTGSGSITTKNCYFDSGIPYFYQNQQNSMKYNDFSSYNASNSVLAHQNIKIKDFMKNNTIGSTTNSGNTISTNGINYCINGDLSSGEQISGASNLLGVSSANFTKTIIPTNNNKSGYAQRIEVLQTRKTLYFDPPFTAPETANYICGIRLKKISGHGSISIGFGGLYSSYQDTDLPLNEEVLLVNSRSARGTMIEKGNGFRGNVTFNSENPTDLVVEIYEVIITMGTTIPINAPLHESAKTKVETLNYGIKDQVINVNDVSRFRTGLELVNPTNVTNTPENTINFINIKSYDGTYNTQFAFISDGTIQTRTHNGTSWTTWTTI